MSKLPVSVHVLTWNSGKTLERALQSVRDCAEILVIDGGSTDDTLAIAEKNGARVLPQRMPGSQGKPLQDFAAVRNVGLQHATQPWLLTLDSDEELSTVAIKDIENACKGEAAAYLVPRHYTLHGKTIERASTYPNERIYFFHKDVALQWEKPVHERIALKTGTQIHRLKHGSLAPLPPLSVFYSKLGQYLQIEAAQSRGKGWNHWFTSRLLHTLRSRLIATLRLLKIWLTPGGKRLPFAYEWARYWYAGQLMVKTCPLNR